MIRCRLPLALIALLTACATATSSQLPQEPVVKDFSLPQTDFALGSGLRVLVQENHAAPLVVITTVFAAGATADPPGHEGLAHLIEHLVFRSMPEGGKRAFWDVLKRTGAEFNASTAPDLTTYYATAHRDRLAELMLLEGWRLASTLEGVTEEAFKIEREVVQNELRQRRETTVGNRTLDELFQRLFPQGHPLHRPMAGTHESLASITLDDARKFVATHYRPENCTMVVAGDVRPDNVRQLLGRWPANLLFGPYGPSGPKVPHPVLARTPRPELPAPVSTELVRLKGPVSQPLLLVAWSLPGGLRGRDAILQFAAAAVQGSMQSRFYRKLDDEVIGFQAQALPLADASILLVSAGLRAGADPERARTRLLDAVNGAWSMESNMGLARYGSWSAATALLRASAEPVADSQGLAQFLATTGLTSYYATSLRELAGLTTGQITDYVYKYLDRGRAVSVVFEPESGGALAAGGARGAGGHHQNFGDVVNLIGLGTEEIRKVAHPPGVAALPRFQLVNGLRVVTIHRPALPIAQIHLQIPGGDATTSPYGLASLASRMSDPCGTRGGPALWTVGGSLGESHGVLASRFTVEVMSGNLQNGLAVLADAVTCRHVSDSGSEWNDQRMKERAEHQRERQIDPRVRAEKWLWSTLYPGHPFGLTEPDAEALRGLRHSDVRGYVEAHFKPGGSVAVVVTDAAPATVQRVVQDYYSDWVGYAAAPRPAVPPPQTAPRTIQLFDRKGATQSSLALGCRIGPIAPHRLPAYDLLEAVLTEQAWEMRASWGATYGLHARVDTRPGAAHLLIEGAVETGLTGAAATKLLGLINELATQGPDIKTFTLKRWDLARGFDVGFATPSSLAAAILRADLNGWPLETWDRYPEGLATTSRADVRAAVLPCAGHEVLSIVGDATAVRAQLREHGLTAQ